MDPFTALAAFGAASSIIGKLIGSGGESAAKQQAAQDQYQIAQTQMKNTVTQLGLAQSTAVAQLNQQEIQREQAQLGITTQTGAIQLQQSADELRRQQNLLTRDENAYKLNATNAQEQIAESTDQLNRTSENDQRAIYSDELLKQNIARASDVADRLKDQQDRQIEFLQGRAAELSAQRQQREFVRQGVAARASGLAGSVKEGIQAGSTLRQSRSQVALSNQDYGLAKTQQDLQITQAVAAASTQKRELGVYQRELGVGSREIGYQQQALQENQFELGTQARENSVLSRLQNYGVAAKQFQVADKTAQLNDQGFDINKQISQLYLSAQSQNSGLINQAYANQDTLTGLNLQATQAQGQSQMNIYALQGDIAQQQKKAASAAETGAIFSGIGSAASSLSGNPAATTNVFKNAFGGSSSGATGNYVSTGNVFNTTGSFY